MAVIRNNKKFFSNDRFGIISVYLLLDLFIVNVMSVLQSLVVFLLYLVPGKIVGKLHLAVGLAQTRERLLKLKQLVTVVLGVVFYVDSC